MFWNRLLTGGNSSATGSGSASTPGAASSITVGAATSSTTSKSSSTVSVSAGSSISIGASASTSRAAWALMRSNGLGSRGSSSNGLAGSSCPNDTCTRPKVGGGGASSFNINGNPPMKSGTLDPAPNSDIPGICIASNEPCSGSSSASASATASFAVPSSVGSVS